MIHIISSMKQMLMILILKHKISTSNCMTLSAINDKFDIWCSEEMIRQKKSHKDIFIYCIGYETFEVVKPLYIIFNKINGYIEDNNGSKYLTLISTDENKSMLKKYEKIWIKIENTIRLRSNNMKKNDIVEKI